MSVYLKFLKENFSVIVNFKQENSQVREKIRKLMENLFWKHSFEKESDNELVFELFEIVYKNLYTVNDFSIESVVNSSNKFYAQVDNFLKKYKIWKASEKIEVQPETKKENGRGVKNEK